MIYEIMAPGSVGMIVECVTDNANRTITSLNNHLKDHGARLAPVGFLFSKRGRVSVAIDKSETFEENLDQLLGTVLDAGVEDFKETTSSEAHVEMEFLCQPQDLAKVTTAAMSTGLCRELLSSELAYIPVEQGDALDDETAKTISELVEDLEDDDDVLRVYTTHAI